MVCSGPDRRSLQPCDERRVANRVSGRTMWGFFPSLLNPLAGLHSSSNIDFISKPTITTTIAPGSCHTRSIPRGLECLEKLA